MNLFQKLFDFYKRHLNICLLVVLVTITIYHLIFPEFVSENNGLGWDGSNYARYALHFPELAFNKQLNVYRFQRIFPSGIVYYAAKLLDIPLHRHTVIYLFLGLNIICIFISFGLWLAVCRLMKLSNKGKMLGFTGLFVNFAILKMPFYYPVLTDVIAFTLGMAMLYYYLKNNNYGLISIGLVGAFTFPTVLYGALLLYVFPAKSISQPLGHKYASWNNILAVLTATGFFLLILLFYFYRKVPLINPNTPLVLTISILACLLYLYIVSRNLYQADMYLHTLQNFTRWRRVLVALVIILLVNVVLFSASSQALSSLNYKGMLANTIIEAIANPFAFLVAHVVYVGPVFLVLVYFGKSFLREINKYGLGLHLLILGYVLLSVNSETRVFINAWPFFFAFLCKAVNKVNLPASFYILLFILALSCSKFWFRIAVPAFSEDFFRFPEQRYFMSTGPWMSDSMYLLQGAIALILFLWMYLVYFRKMKVISKEQLL